MNSQAKKNTPIPPPVSAQDAVGLQDAMIFHAHEMAKASLDIYFTDGLGEEDYSYAYQSFSHALLYIQRKRNRPEE